MNQKLFEKVADVTKISHEEWLKLRQTGIGGSDAGAIAGLSKWSSPFTVYADKLNIVPPKEDNEAMRQGRDFEDYVAKRFEEKEGKKVKRYNWLIRSKEYPWALADLDRVIVGEDAILECKTTKAFDKTDFENGEIQPYWYCQVQHYLAVTGCKVAYLSILVLGSALYTVIVERNEEEIKILMDLEKEFWEENVLKQIEPALDGSDRADEVLEKMYGKSDSTLPTVDLTPYNERMNRLKEVKDSIKALETEEKQIEQELKDYLKDAEKGSYGNYKVTWKSQDKTTIDTKKLKAELPEVYNQYSKTSSSRTFRFMVKEDY